VKDEVLSLGDQSVENIRPSTVIDVGEKAKN
jgi:hypothetical protein